MRVLQVRLLQQLPGNSEDKSEGAHPLARHPKQDHDHRVHVLVTLDNDSQRPPRKSQELQRDNIHLPGEVQATKQARVPECRPGGDDHRQSWPQLLNPVPQDCVPD